MIYHGDPEHYIYETSGILKEILEQRKNIFQDALQKIDWENCKRLCLTGSGSSYHGALCARPFLRKVLKCPVDALIPMACIADCEYFEPESVVIGISQQGTSLSSIKALDEAGKRGFQTVSMTGEYDTEIIRHGRANLYIECGMEDAGATTKGYTATAFTLMLLGLEAAKATERITEEEYDMFLERLLHTVEGMPRVLQASEAWYKRNRTGLLRCGQMVVTGYAQNFATVLEGTLKIMETCRFPVRGYEVEEFMHGIYNSVDEQTQMIYIGAPGAEQERIFRLYDYYKEKLTYNYFFGGHEVREQNLTDCFTDDEDFSPLEYILVFQILILRLSRDRGINMNIPKDPKFHIKMASKLEEET